MTTESVSLENRRQQACPGNFVFVSGSGNTSRYHWLYRRKAAPTMNDLSEDDVSVKFITPAIVMAGWDEATQIRRQVSFTKGRIIVRGRTGPVRPAAGKSRYW